MAVSLPGYGGTGFKFAGSSVGQVVSSALPYVFVAAGLILLLMLILGGIKLMTAAGDAGKSKGGYDVISNALIGFTIVFISYFVVQVVEVVLGVSIF